MARTVNIIAIFLILAPMFAYAGECKLVQKVCKEGAEERDVEGFRVHRDCWKYENLYQCDGYTENSCQALREDGCVQVNSECSKRERDWCVGYKKTFKCEKQEAYTRKETRYRLPQFAAKDHKNRKHISCSEALECLDGKCFNQTAQTNNELGEAVAMLQTLKELQNKASTEPIVVFKGQQEYCRKKAFGLNNCCKAGKAWVARMHLSSCKGEEKALIEHLSKKLCTYVGSYSKKKLGIKEFTQHTYCCFQSPFVRILQEQGKRQLGRGFGTAKNPDCSGVTVDELQRIDFQAINFSELFKDIFDSAGRSMPAITGVTDDLQKEMGRIKESLEKNENTKIKGQHPKYNEEGLL